VDDGRKCSRQITISLVVVVKISEAQIPMHESSELCYDTIIVKYLMIKTP
jgi:hypothetical protein